MCALSKIRMNQYVTLYLKYLNIRSHVCFFPFFPDLNCQQSVLSSTIHFLKKVCFDVTQPCPRKQYILGSCKIRMNQYVTLYLKYLNIRSHVCFFPFFPDLNCQQSVLSSTIHFLKKVCFDVTQPCPRKQYTLGS